jgi:hypothetical protein
MDIYEKSDSVRTRLLSQIKRNLANSEIVVESTPPPLIRNSRSFACSIIEFRVTKNHLMKIVIEFDFGAKIVSCPQETTISLFLFLITSLSNNLLTYWKRILVPTSDPQHPSTFQFSDIKNKMLEPQDFCVEIIRALRSSVVTWGTQETPKECHPHLRGGQEEPAVEAALG